MLVGTVYLGTLGCKSKDNIGTFGVMAREAIESLTLYTAGINNVAILH